MLCVRLAVVLLSFGIAVVLDVFEGHFVEGGSCFGHVGAEVDNEHVAWAAGDVEGVDPWTDDVGVWAAIWIQRSGEQFAGGFGVDVEGADLGGAHEAKASVFLEPKGRCRRGARSQVGVYR